MRSNPDSPGNRSRRTGLFVVRIWREDTGTTTNSAEGVGSGDRGRQWKGRVQRAVSGEEHQFEGWSALIEVLEEMLSDVRRVGKPERDAARGQETQE
jgi:hypothetical protein